MYKTGIVFGKFYPLHNGHINLINRAAAQCETLYVVLSYSKHNILKDSQDLKLKQVSLNDQLKWLHYTFKDIPHIKIVHIDESDIPQYPNGWNEWSILISKKITQFDSYSTAFFISDQSYFEDLKKYFPLRTIIVIDPEHNEIPISSTLIRERGIFHFWEYLPTIVRRHFLFKVAIIGTESTGKTTLCKYLAKRFCTSYVAEYGREYVINELAGNEKLLTHEDFLRIAHGHKLREYQEEKTANKILIIDTESMITHMYYQLYLYNECETLYNMTEEQNYDLILYLKPDGVKWIDDGIRINNTKEQIEYADDILESLVNLHYEQYGTFNTVPIVRISGSYSERLDIAINEIKKHSGIQ